MLYILAALKCEASALNGLPGEIIVTGVGGRACDRISKMELTANDAVLNVGVCAGGEKGKGYLINQVISAESGRRYYPDILFGQGIPEMPLTTSAEIVTELEDGMLYDMEAAMVCDKALKTVPPSNLAIYKVVSDNGSGFPSANEVTALLRGHRGEIAAVCEALLEGICGKQYGFLPDGVADEMRLTQYMRNELKDIEHYCVAAGREDELLSLLDRMREDGRLPVKDKRAGREVLDEIYSYLR